MSQAYLREFEAEITKISNDKLKVYLDKTTFYPGGGGQPNDIGTLTHKGVKFEVIKVGRDEERNLYHQLNKPITAKIGDPVQGEIDWEKRYVLMRYHTALHVLCGLIWKEFGASVTGGNMYLNRARMDFNMTDFSKEKVDYIEKRVNEEIQASHEVLVKVLPRDEAFKIPDLIRTKINLLPPQIKEIRTIEIVGLDLQADGGTHVKNTQEIGVLRITETINKGKDNKRIVIVLE